jgi:molybdopterin synthase catalytic subunit
MNPPTEISAAISADPLDVSAAVASVSSPDCGGLGIFVGTVRTSAAAPGRVDVAVVRLDYDAHPVLAPRRLHEIATSAAAKWDLRKVVALHRSGPCEVGEPTVVVACAAPHRSDALDACRYMIEEIKTTVPIWKREVYADGSSWLGVEGALPEERA